MFEDTKPDLPLPSVSENITLHKNGEIKMKKIIGSKKRDEVKKKIDDIKNYYKNKYAKDPATQTFGKLS